MNRKKKALALIKVVRNRFNSLRPWQEFERSCTVSVTGYPHLVESKLSGLIRLRQLLRAPIQQPVLQIEL